MSKFFIFNTVFFLFLSLQASVFAAGEKIPTEILSPASDEPKKPLRDDVFSVSTEDLDLSENLNRVAGEIDRGFSSPEQSFSASDHTAGAGPFAREKAEMASKDRD